MTCFRDEEMRPVSVVFPGFVAIDKKSLFLLRSIGIIALSVKGKGSYPSAALNADFHIKKVEKTRLILQDTCVQIQTERTGSESGNSCLSGLR
jgi:hypothetical protein